MYDGDEFAFVHDEIDGAAENTPSRSHGGPIYAPSERTANHDLAVLLAHYGIASDPVTTNLDEASLEEQIGSRTVSRLVEICGDPLPLFGEDQRFVLGE